MSTSSLAADIYSDMPAEKLEVQLEKNRWPILESILNTSTPYRETTLSPDYERPFPKAVRLSGREIHVPLDYQNADFNEPLYFQSTHFFSSPQLHKVTAKSSVDFDAAVFEKPFDIYWSRFDQGMRFNRAVFHDHFYLSSSLIHGSALFVRSIFHGDANFDSTIFDAQVDFHGAYFKDAASFRSARFDKTVNFRDVQSYGPFDFNHSQINAPVDFSNAHLMGGLSFREAEVADTLNFSRANLDGLLDFAYLETTKSIDLSDIVSDVSGETIAINLTRTDPRLFMFSYDRFHLVFDPSLPHKEKVFLYESLIEMQRSHGFKEGLRKAAVEYKQYVYGYENKDWTNLFQKYGWDYGFDPERILWWIGGVVLLFSSINALFYRSLVENVMDVPFLSRHAHSDFVESRPLFRYIFYFPLTLVFTIMLLFSHLMGFKRDFTDFRSRSIWVNVYIFALMVVGVICSLFVLNYILGRTIL